MLANGNRVFSTTEVFKTTRMAHHSKDNFTRIKKMGRARLSISTEHIIKASSVRTKSKASESTSAIIINMRANGRMERCMDLEKASGLTKTARSIHFTSVNIIMELSMDKESIIGAITGHLKVYGKTGKSGNPEIL
jgi:hypothetical protein